MSAWVVVPCLLKLRDEINALAPKRDKGADGTISDSAHTSKSDHTPDEDSDYLKDHDADSKNEVHALDIDVDLKTPGLSLEQIVRQVIGDPRLKYVIFNRRIWSASNGWKPQEYTGADPHTNHAHFSASYVTARENDTSPWLTGLKGADMSLGTKEDRAELIKELLDTKLSSGVSLGGTLVQADVRTKAINGTQLPAVLAGISAIPSADVDEEAIAEAISADISDTLATSLLDKLKARLES